MLARNLNPVDIDQWNTLDAVALLSVFSADAGGDGSLYRIDKAIAEPLWMTDETWGTSPESQSAVAQMEAAIPLDEDDPEVAAYLASMRAGRTGDG